MGYLRTEREHSLNVRDGTFFKKSFCPLAAVMTFSLCFVLSDICSINLPICYFKKNPLIFSRPDVVPDYVQHNSTQ